MFNIGQSASVKKILTVLTGTASAQLLPVLIMPLLTRLYLPSEIGEYGTFMSYAAIFSAVICFRLDFSVLLPKTNKASMQGVKVSLSIALLVAVISYLAWFSFAILNRQLDFPSFAVFVPLLSLLLATYQICIYWMNRRGDFSKLAKSRFIQSAGISGGQLFLAKPITGFDFGLISSTIIGVFVSVSIVAKSMVDDFKKYHISWGSFKYILKKYKKFPLYDLPAVVLNITSNQAQIILTSHMLDIHSAGQFFLAQKVVMSPMSVISAAVGDVFRQEALDEIKEKGVAKQAFLRSFKILASLSLPIASVFYFFSDYLFSVVFGAEWRQAGEIVSIFSPMFALRFVASPLSFIIYARDAQKLNIFGSAALFLTSAVPFFVFSDIFEIATSISFGWSVIYFFYIVISARLAKVF